MLPRILCDNGSYTCAQRKLFILDKNMHLTIEKKILVKSLAKLHSIVERKHSILILANVKLKAVGNSTFLSVTDMDLDAVEELPAEVKESGSVTIPVRTLFDIVKKLPDSASVEIIFNKQNMGEGASLKSDRIECFLPVLPADEFPSFAEAEYKNKFTLEAKKLKTLFANTKYAILPEETRYYLNGVFLHSLDNSDGAPVLRAVATDSHRLATAEITLDKDAEQIDGIIVPRKTVNELIKLLEDIDSTVELYFANNRIMLTCNYLKFSSKLIDGRFPDYNKAIPKQYSHYFEVSTKSLSEAIDLVTTIALDKIKAVKFHISPGKVILSVHNNINGASRASQEISAHYNGESLMITFNAKYILDVLSAINGPVVSFSILSSNHAILLRDAADGSAMHIVMPMQI